jgi:phage recombination protein Bet
MNNIASFPPSDNGAQSPQLSEQKIQRETILEYLNVFGFIKSLSNAEQNQFIQTALAGNLDPFKREIYLAVYGEGENRKLSILTGYQVYLKRAERTGNLDGWRAWLEGDGPQMKAVIEIFRKDWSHSFTHEVYWEEAVQKKKDGSPTQFWAKQPRFQLRKVAIAQGFRFAFPDELGSLPYESSELPDNDAPPETHAPVSTNSVKTPTQSLAEQAASDDGPDDKAPSQQQQPQNPPKPVAQTSVNTPPKAQAPSPQKLDLNEEVRAKLIQRIEDLFEEHPEDFTRKHRDWILNNALKATDKTGIDKMVAYTEKIIRKAA